MATISGDISVREMKEVEIDDFFDICQRSSIYTITREEILRLHKVYPNIFLVATLSTEEIIALCFAVCYVPNRIIITGFAVAQSFQNDLPVHKEILFKFISFFPNVERDITVPETMTTYLEHSSYLQIWHVHCYAYDTAKRVITLPVFSNNWYTVTNTEGSGQEQFLLYYNAPLNFTNTISIVPDEIKATANFKLFEGNDSRAIGYGAIDEKEEGCWLIGPLIAPGENTARIILEEILNYALAKKAKKILIYILVSDEVRTEFLETNGFTRLNRWVRYISPEINVYVFQHLRYTEARKTMFALYDPFLHTL